MINDATATKCIIDGDVRDVGELNSMDISDEGAVYEVIRIIGKVPLFFDDHMRRMQKSIELLGWDSEVNTAEASQCIKCVVLENGLTNCNVKIVYYSLPDMNKFLLYVSKSYYPKEDVYKKGVALATLRWSRNNPHTKRINHDYKAAVSDVIVKNNVFEALLVNGDSIVTEGSRSNIFFVKDDIVYTAKKELILEGITRKHVFDVCSALGIEVKEVEIKVEKLVEYDGVFLTGTSIHVLPVSRIDDIYYKSSSNPALVKIRRAFSSMVDEYIKDNS